MATIVKTITASIGLLLSISASAQSDIKIPDITPPSPEAYQLTKYGDVPINEFTGMVSANIPLYAYKAGQLELPISLNYSGGGVKVDQLSTWTGVNWSLNAGGVISRTIHDNPDEVAYNRMWAEDIIPMNLHNGSGDAILLNNIYRDDNLAWDTKPDVFNYAFAGYSGSFYLDENYQPRFTKVESQLKIEIVGTETSLKARLYNGNQFCMTTPEGIKYYFGGIDATENSFLTYTGHEYVTYNVPTSYYLNRITHPVDGIIFFEYTKEPFPFQIGLSQSQGLTMMTSSNPLPIPAGTLGSENCDDGGTSSPMGNPMKVFNRIANGKFLKRIYSGNHNISVNFTVSGGSLTHYRKVLNTIEVKNGNSVLMKVGLSYIQTGTLQTAQRFFLSTVEFNKDFNYSTVGPGGRKYEVYKMEYNDPLGLPARFAFSQDHAGYYNGKTNNGNLLPKNDNLYLSAYNSSFADRDPDFNYAVKGTLAKLIYPTGGYSEFEYEAPLAKDYEKTVKTMTIWRNGFNNRLPVNQTSASYTGGVGSLILDPDPALPPTGNAGSLIDQEMSVKITLQGNYYMGHTDRIYFKLNDITDNTSVTRFVIMPDPDLNNTSGIYEFPAIVLPLLKDHRYTMQLYNNYSSTVPFEATAVMSFVKGYKEVRDTGLRIKRIRDTDPQSNASANVKRYYYRKAGKVYDNSLSSLPFVTKPNYIEKTALVKCCTSSLHAGDMVFQQLKLKSSPFGIFQNDTIEKKYKNVTISFGGDNFETGGREKTFFYERNQFHISFKDATNLVIGYSGANFFEDEEYQYQSNANDVKNGALLMERDLMVKNGAFFKTRETSNSYLYQTLHGRSGVTGGISAITCINDFSNYDHLKIGFYGVFSKKSQIGSVTSKEFAVPMPLNSISEIPYRPITTTKTFEYGDLAGLPVKITSTTSDASKSSIVQHTYAGQYGLLSGLTGPQVSCYQTLVSQNRISEPIETKAFENTSLLTTKRTLYKKWAASDASVQPEIIQFAKASLPLQDWIILSEYDIRNRPSLFSYKNGSKTKYFYNGMGSVTRKIEHYIAPPETVPAAELELVEFIPSTAPADPCSNQNNFPDSIVTDYYYSPVTNQLTATSSLCRYTYYEYDSMFRIKRIKDHEGNIIQSFDYNFKL